MWLAKNAREGIVKRTAIPEFGVIGKEEQYKLEAVLVGTVQAS